MADFCGNCGTQLRAGAKFCQSCGTGVPAAAPPSSTASLPPTLPITAMPTTPPAAPYSSGYEPPAYAPTHAISMQPERPKSRGVLKAVLITLAIFMVLIVGSGIGLVYFISKKAHEIGQRVKVDPDGVHLPLPGGDIDISKNGAVTEEKLGLPIYQPSTASEESVTVQAGNAQGRGAIVVGHFTTEDDADEVADFYREHMQNEEGFVEQREGKRGEIVLLVKGGQSMKTVSIKPHGKDGQTEFVITSIGGTPFGKNFPPGNIPHPPPPPVPPNAPNAPQ